MHFKLYFFIFFVFLFSFLFTQEGETEPSFGLKKSILFDTQNLKYETSLEKYYETRSIIRTIAPQILEEVLDENIYKVGPGDVFEIHIWSELESIFFVNVNPSGTIVIPTVGEISVIGLTIEETKHKVIDEIKKMFKTDNISVNLVELRKFRVYLTGAVKLPGTYFAQATDRLADIVEVATGFIYWTDINNIEIRHKDGSIDTVSLRKFYVNGDNDNNPYVKGGDVIYVPDIAIDKGYLVYGNSTIYPYIENECLYEFLLRTNTIKNTSDLSHIMITRDGREIDLNLLNNDSEDRRFVLKKYDIIIVPDIEEKVYLRGQVQRPGEYPFIANNTAKEYIGRAGLPVSAAGDGSVIIIRYKDGKVIKGSHHMIEKGDTIIVPRRMKEDIKEYIAILVPVASIVLSTYAILKK